MRRARLAHAVRAEWEPAGARQRRRGRRAGAGAEIIEFDKYASDKGAREGSGRNAVAIVGGLPFRILCFATAVIVFNEWSRMTRAKRAGPIYLFARRALFLGFFLFVFGFEFLALAVLFVGLLAWHMAVSGGGTAAEGLDPEYAALMGAQVARHDSLSAAMGTSLLLPAAVILLGAVIGWVRHTTRE